jgi:hypothetical protein
MVLKSQFAEIVLALPERDDEEKEQGVAHRLFFFKATASHLGIR